MNIYSHDFKSTCPNNGAVILYELEIQSHCVIMVEDIVAACTVESTYHEPLADRLYERFGGVQLMTAFHHGVRIQTVRPSHANIK